MYSRILVPIDGSETSLLALSHAADIGRAMGAALVLLHVLEETRYSNGFERPSTYFEDTRPNFLKAGRALLDDALQTLHGQSLVVETALVEAKGVRVGEHIAHQAALCGCDLVVLGTHGRRGLERMMLGSDAELVARIAPAPVLLVRKDLSVPKAAYDGSVQTL